MYYPFTPIAPAVKRHVLEENDELLRLRKRAEPLGVTIKQSQGTYRYLVERGEIAFYTESLEGVESLIFRTTFLFK